MKKKLLILAVLVSVLMPVVMTGMTRAASCEGVQTAILSCGDEESGIGHILSLTINIASVAIGIIAVIGIVIAGMQYMTAGGNEEQTRKAKRRIFELVIGLAVYALAYVLLAWLLPGGTLNPSNIEHFDAPEWSNSTSGLGSGGSSSSGSSGNNGGQVKKYLDEESGFFKKKYDEGYTFDYWLNIPEDATENMPLVIYLHGDGEVDGGLSAIENLASVRAMKASKDFIMIAPHTRERDWQNKNKTDTLKGLIDEVVNKYKVDKSKIYIMGMSRGAMGAWNMVVLYPELFAAAVPVSGCPSGTDEAARKFYHTKVKAMVGSLESYKSCMNDFVDKIKNVGTASLEVVDGASHLTVTGMINYDDLFSWLLRQ